MVGFSPGHHQGDFNNAIVYTSLLAEGGFFPGTSPGRFQECYCLLLASERGGFPLGHHLGDFKNVIVYYWHARVVDYSLGHHQGDFKNLSVYVIVLNRTRFYSQVTSTEARGLRFLLLDFIALYRGNTAR